MLVLGAVLAVAGGGLAAAFATGGFALAVAGTGGAAGTITGRRYMAVRRSSIVSSVFGRINVAPHPEQNLASTLLSVPQMLHFIAVPRKAIGPGGPFAPAPWDCRIAALRWPTAGATRMMINENTGPHGRSGVAPRVRCSR
jgi:hypothetical protein